MIICGVDEAGRGPLAGPVTAAAVILGENFPIDFLADSKVLTERRRDSAAVEIKGRAIAWSVAWATHREVDRLNILQASLLAMRRAVFLLNTEPDEVLIDGDHTPDLPWPARAVVRGDATEPSIMAASILAKTCRDKWMTAYAQIRPEYGFERHKGYPTRFHRNVIRVHGRSEIHRVTFRVT